MSEATARSGSSVASAGALALAVLCSQQFIMAYDTVSMNVATSSPTWNSYAMTSSVSSNRSSRTCAGIPKETLGRGWRSSPR